MDRWLHFSEGGGDGWVLPIWAAVHTAMTAGRVAPIPRALSELGVHISTRLNFFPRIVDRINTGCGRLRGLARRRRNHHESTVDREGYALPIDNDLKYRFLIDVDALLFELTALYDLWLEFFLLMHRHALTPMPCRTADASIRHIVESDGNSAKWLGELARHRNYFMHRGAPYLAMDISGNRLDLLLLKANVRNLSTSTSFVRLSQINDLVQGFRRTKQSIQEHLVGLFS
jgi:hypothetical protein